MPVITTIHLYGTVEVDLAVMKHLDNTEINEILDREISAMCNDMKREFWNNYGKRLNK